MIIKTAVESDSLRLNNLKEVEWPSVDAAHFEDRELVDFDEHELTLIAEEGEEVAGYIKIRTEMGTCEIESLIVGNKFRNKGVATQLVLRAEDLCKRMKIHKIFLETGVNWEAKKLYEKLGYESVCVLKKHYANKDFVLMEKIVS
jgi:ribosomal protein S18 acetylase RimI-like enzyme